MNNLSFFLASNDISSLNQTLLQAYGPVDGYENTQYRVTSKLSVNSLNTFAASDGELIVCNVTGQSDKLNLILKPNINYTSEVFKGTPKVKYFVYRGISKSSFFDTGGVVKTTKDNHILNSLNIGSGIGSLSIAQKKMDFADSLILITSLTATELIDNLFTQEDYYQIEVQAGDKLGLCTDDFGFEIMLEENGFNPNIKQAKLLENNIDVTTPGGLSNIEKEVKRLEILNYIDPTAFFGLFFRKNALLFDPKNGKSVPTNSPHYFRWHQYLFLDKFFTANTIYIDIRNNYSLPPTINKVGKSFSQIKISVDGNSPVTPTNYQCYNKTSIISAWPIHILDGTFTHSPTSSNYDYFKIKIAIENKTAKELFHVLTNHLGDSWEKEYNHKVQYEKLEDKDSSWKKDVELRTYKANDTKGVASYIKIEVAEYSTESKIEDQIVNYQLHNLTAESITNQLSPSLIDLGNSNNFTREKEGAPQNKYNTHIYGLGATIYSENRNIGCEVTRGKAVDSIGEICFAYRTEKSLQASGIALNHDKLAKVGEGATQISKKLHTQSFAYNTIKNSFQDPMETVSGENDSDDNSEGYFNKVAIHNHQKKNKSILGIHRVSFIDGMAKKALEIRINDPIILRGLTGNSPAECFTSIAYTNAQKQIINTFISSEFVTKRFVAFQSKSTTELTGTGRKVFKQTFDLIGLKANGNTLELQPSSSALNLTFYSVDGANFSTTEYAAAFRNEEGIDNVVTDKVITNDVVPNFDAGNPFGNLLTSIRTTLNSISNGGVRDRILYNEVRDYLYDGDLDNLTFEIAFRLPFYIEDINQIPYTQIVNVGITIDNNPYIDYFEQDTPSEEWFTLANDLRRMQTPPLEDLTRSGLNTLNSNKKTYEKEFYDAAEIKQEAYFQTVNLPVNAATTFNWENPKSYFNIKGKYPHLPYSNGSTHNTNSYDLTHLVNATVITSAKKTSLEAIKTEDFGYVEIADGSYVINGQTKILNGKYLFKKKNETVFKIYDFYWSNPKNNSGITFGFGYDIGGRSDYNGLLDYLNLSAANVTGIKQTVLNNSLGKRKIDAMKEFFPFKEVVWDTIKLEYNVTIDKTKPILQDEYLNNIIQNIVKSREYLKIYHSSQPLFYKNDEIKIINIAELCIYSTFIWNRGADRANLNYDSNSTSNYKRRRAAHARFLIHAFNTHDIRWLRCFVQQSGITHTDKVLTFLALPGIIKSYRL